ncbi:MAG: cyclic nucleotide-binding domain-containing protein [Actinobacteria bacterium]|nr:MAG: cyclic nucleotide-binding domain-containing protein [Actinomycetota bacterium]
MDPNRLKAITLFQNMSDDDLSALATLAEETSVPEGQEVVREGDFSYQFFAIEEGSAAVERDGRHVNDLGPGDFFGEIGVLEKELRTATVRATSPMRLIILSRWDLKRLERRDPSAFDQIRETLEARR